ncbi:unnamed protein product, partial [Mesorhabditis spiculigera]
MEVINKMVTLLPNVEVLKIINETRARETKKKKHDQDSKLSTLLFETSSYLNQTPVASQNEEHFCKLVEVLKPVKLTQAEILQIANLRPSSSIELQLIIEDCEERIKTEEQLELLVQCYHRWRQNLWTRAKQPTDRKRANTEYDRAYFGFVLA